MKNIKRIFIDVAELQSPNSAGGCDYYFDYVNNSDKTIKYLQNIKDKKAESFEESIQRILFFSPKLGKKVTQD